LLFEEWMPGRKKANAIDAQIGVRLRLRRTALGLSQSALGRELGLTFQQVQKYENGKNRISAGHLYRIALLLGVPISYFFDALAEKEPSIVQPEFSQAKNLAVWRAFSRIRRSGLRHSLLKLVEALAAPCR
jgi:transcriptional regulator with XRE-family HTH domain